MYLILRIGECFAWKSLRPEWGNDAVLHLQLRVFGVFRARGIEYHPARHQYLPYSVKLEEAGRDTIARAAVCERAKGGLRELRSMSVMEWDTMLSAAAHAPPTATETSHSECGLLGGGSSGDNETNLFAALYSGGFASSA